MGSEIKTKIRDLPKEKVSQLAEDLNEIFSNIYYRESSLNAFLGDFIYNQVILRRYEEYSKKDFLKYKLPNLHYFLKYLIYTKIQSFKSTKAAIDLQDKSVFTWISIKEHCSSLVLPVVSLFKENEIAVVGVANEMSAMLSKGNSFYKFTDLYRKTPLRIWHSRFNKIDKSIQSRLNEILMNYNLSTTFKTDLMNILYTATQFYESCYKVLSHTRPKSVVTEYDRNFYSSVLISCARSLGISTFTFIHGTVNDKSAFYPFNSEKIFCWGKKQKDLIESWSVNEDNIIIAGNQKMREYVYDTGKITDIKKRNDLDIEKSVVTLTPNPLLVSERIKLVKVFCEAANGSDEFNFCIKFHPSDTKHNYSDLMDQYSGIKFIDSDEMSFEEMMSITDIFVIHNSSIGVEALFHKKRVIVLNVLDVPLYNVEELVLRGFVDVAFSVDEFREQLSQSPHGNKEELDIFIKEYYQRTGKEASIFIAKEIMAT